MKPWIAQLFLLFAFCSTLLSQQFLKKNTSSNFVQEWTPYYKSDTKDIDREVYKNQTNTDHDSVNYNHKIKLDKKGYTDSNDPYSTWEKLNGPEGGSVRHFYKIDGEVYGLTDRYIFKLKSGTWKSLGELNFYGNTIMFLYSISPEKFLVGTDFGLFYSDSGGNEWKQIIFGDGTLSATSIFETKKGDLLISTNKGIYISTNKSLVFTLLTLNGIMVNTINIDSNDNIWVGTNTGILKAKYGEFIWQTMNLNQTWYTKILIDSRNTIFAISFNQLLRSTDSGNSWSFIQGPHFVDITFDPNENVIATSAYEIFRMSFKGIQWSSEKSKKFMLTTFLLNENEMLVGLLGGGARKYNLSTNSFENFNKGLNASTIRGLLQMKNGNILASTDADSLFVSNDNGLTWKSTYECWTRFMKSSSTGLVYVGAMYGILRSSDSGNTWNKLNLNVDPYYVKYFDISDDDKIICAVSSTNEVHLSTDYGKNFKLIKKGDGTYITALKIINNSTYIFHGSRRLYFTSDFGKTVTLIPDCPIDQVNEFIEDNLGYVYASTPKGLFKSFDGTKWTEVSSKMSGLMYMKINKDNVFYGIGGDGGVYVSYDLGKSWSTLLFNFNNTVFWSYVITDEGYVFNGSQDDGLFRNKIPVQTENIERGQFSINNFPNPFNTTTRIEYTVPKNTFVEIKVFNILGQEIETLVSENRTGGIYFVNWNPQNLSSGIYFCRLSADSYTQTNKLILLK